MVITSMGRLPVLYIPKNMLLSLFSPLRNNNSRSTEGQNQEFWMNEMVKQHFMFKIMIFQQQKKWMIHTGMMYIV
jgi:hypothetical protein